ncbi:NDP-hexose 2,3-dehydratase family protein [Streptomyces sp. ADI96-02]|uniref:NDP-hexose 2,3-dehydratase family protein n=1 Tax=Streptomyces sp. ADI96-02 TaxID=1522760 RepID=UPI001F1549C9|nr:NDP-hexose 2,3-dehydratase family protein [Streptomyces sp. ADI96-02]
MTTRSRTPRAGASAPYDAPHLRIARSALADPGAGGADRFHDWLAAQKEHADMRVRQVALEDLAGWRTDPATGNLVHETGRFYSVEGLDVHVPGGPVERWQQPIINQPEVGILGILVKEFDGVLHCLMQAKIEPGNHNGLQLSPTVQATRSNYTRVHRGAEVPYLRHFRDASRHRVLADVRQSEQGAWFFRKRNRNMVVQATEDVEQRPGFIWLTLHQLHTLLRLDDLVNMDARSVLACLPFTGPGLPHVLGTPRDDFTAALVRSCDGRADAPEAPADVLHWITEVRTRRDVAAERVPLRALAGWRGVDGRIAHESGRFFRVAGVDVTAVGREVRAWAQPMIEPCGRGVIAFLVRRIDGVLHLLVHAATEPGYVDGVELAPTVQCTPDSLAALPARARPRHLDAVLNAASEQIRFDAVHSEEGGRFYHARNRYLIVETDEDHGARAPDHRWLTVAQLVALMRHSHYVNVQARCLLACLHGLTARSGPVKPSAALS